MTGSQHMEALAEANRIRFARADLKRELRRGKVTLAEAFEHPDVGSMPVFALLCAQWRYREARSRRALRDAAGLLGLPVPLSEGKTVGSLTDRQKRALLQACGENKRSAAA